MVIAESSKDVNPDFFQKSQCFFLKINFQNEDTAGESLLGGSKAFPIFFRKMVKSFDFISLEKKGKYSALLIFLK